MLKTSVRAGRVWQTKQVCLKCALKQVHRCCLSHADGQCVPRRWTSNGERTFSELVMVLMVIVVVLLAVVVKYNGGVVVRFIQGVGVRTADSTRIRHRLKWRSFGRWGEGVFLLTYLLILASNRHHLSCDDCLEDKSEDYQNCSVLYCVPQLYRIISLHDWLFPGCLGI